MRPTGRTGIWSTLAFFAVVAGADIASRSYDRFRSACLRHDTRGALSRMLIDRKIGYDLRVEAAGEVGREADRIVCRATFEVIRPADGRAASIHDVRYTVTASDRDDSGMVEIPADQLARIATAP